jgi:glycosyltransferase involved in cell wall biosynthesis
VVTDSIQKHIQMKQPIPILMVVHSYYPLDPRVRREAEAAAQAGYKVDIVCLRNHNEKTQEEISDIHIYRLPVKRHRGKGFVTYLIEYLTFFIYALVKTTLLFTRKRYRVIQVHTMPDFLVFCALVPRLFGSSVILDMHEVMPEFFSYRYGLQEKHPLLRMLILVEKCAIRFVHQVITVSDTLKEILINRGIAVNKVTIIMNVADDKIFLPEIAVKKLTNPSQHNQFTMAYHGLLADIYDLETVFNALSVLKKKIANMRFLVIGDGPRKQYYQDIVCKLGLESNVSFTGQYPQEEIPQLLEKVDLGVIPIRNNYYTEVAFPTKLVEYVASGIPVVIARRKTVEKYFDNKAVAFFEPGDVQSLAEIIYNLYKTPDKRHQLAQNSWKQYQSITWPVMKKRYYELLNKLV